MRPLDELFGEGYLTLESSTIRQAMEAITANKRGAIVVVDEAGTLRGIASDGDIRRALLKGGTELTPIGKCVNPNPTVLREKETSDEVIKKTFEEHQAVTLIPVINAQNVVVDVVIR